MSRSRGPASGLSRFCREVKAAAKRADWAQVAALAEARLDERPDCAEAHYASAVAAIYRDDLAMAQQAAATACELAPGTADHEDLLAIIYGLAGEVNDALFHGKAAAGCRKRSPLSGILPETFPTLAQVFIQISEQPLLNRATHAMERGAWADAEIWFRQHLAFAPDCREAGIGLGVSLLAQDQPLAAVEALRGLRHRLPQDAALASLLGRALSQIGGFEQARACHRFGRALAPDDAELAAVALADAACDPREDVAAVLAAYEAWGRTFGIDDGRCLVAQGGERRSLTVGYLIANATRSPVAQWLADILSHRRSDRFTRVGFGYGPLSAPANLVFQKCVDRWQDVGGADALTLAAMVRAEGIDILVDLAGLGAPELHAAFASRMAPCQVAWLGAPSLGLKGFDFVLTDRYVGNPGAGNSAVPAAMLRLGSVIVPPPAPVARPARGDDDELLFMADAGLGELNAMTVERWAAILHAVPEAKLVLRDRGFTQADALKRVLDVFGTFAVAHRIDVIAEASSAAFFAHGDVALLPYPCPRPASVVDALSAGLPVVCPAGRTPSSRAAASVLDHLGIAGDTVAEDGEAYVALALRWARSAPERQALPERIEEAARASRMWNAAERANDLAAALEATWTEVAGREQPLALAAEA